MKSVRVGMRWSLVAVAVVVLVGCASARDKRPLSAQFVGTWAGPRSNLAAAKGPAPQLPADFTPRVQFFPDGKVIVVSDSPHEGTYEVVQQLGTNFLKLHIEGIGTQTYAIVSVAPNVIELMEAAIPRQLVRIGDNQQ
jgi:hypothetical protein